jgi:hypothetical protein
MQSACAGMWTNYERRWFHIGGMVWLLMVHLSEFVGGMNHVCPLRAVSAPQTGESTPPVITSSVGAANGAVLESCCICIG